MKIIIYLLILFPIILLGCSSTNNIENYKTKKDFYKEFNDNAHDKQLKIILKNKSPILTGAGAAVKNDSMILFNTDIHTEKRTLLLNDIKEIDYYGWNLNNKNAYLELKNGKKLNAQNINILNGEMNFTDIERINKKIPLNEVEEITYKKRWLTAGEGFSIGFIMSYFLFSQGILPPYKKTGWTSYINQHISSHLPGLLIWPVAGAIIGYLIGHSYIYQFSSY